MLFFLASCSSQLPFTGATGRIEVQDTSETEYQNEPLVENLVSEAGIIGRNDLAGVGQVLLNDSAQPADDEQEAALIEPVTPTIPMTANRVVERAINDLLQNRQTLLKLWIERSATYFPMIEQIFAEEGVPDELKYVALGESSLRPSARSYAGAVGMWQFMPGTGTGAGLEINGWVDERMDPEKSTRAAARHFLELYAAYGNNWHLALAGYNCSYRCISRAVFRAGGTIEQPPSFWEIYPFLPRETREFVPKFIAAALIVSNPSQYGIAHDVSGSPLTYDVVQISGMMSLETASQLAGTTIAELKDLNPSLRRNTLPDSNTPFALKLPFGSYQRFVDNFQKLPPAGRKSPTEYIVSRGDTLGSIATRFGVSVRDLQSFNSIANHLIYPDQKLLIPGTGSNHDIAVVSREPVSISYHDPVYRPIRIREEFQLVEQRVGKDREPVISVVLSTNSNDFTEQVPTVYQVKGGDTLGSISRRFDVSVRELQQWNNLRSTLIRVGQNLTIHSENVPRATIYRVQRGDNLGAIARRFGVTVDNLKSWNGLNSDLIFPGQDLQLN